MINTKFSIVFVTGQRKGNVAGTPSNGLSVALLHVLTWVGGMCFTMLLFCKTIDRFYVLLSIYFNKITSGKVSYSRF